ncbi:hypothetical protein BDV40DRAFT_75910 [Aspergillus tamarii]|uniref:Uncharacterized protein n=1 Tax=Aspergillus tamarii TaxID=41984 RepID=A0A5N6UD51_ASPTM|nr:hypothetical protein BDV40DRAFT_75910 [Aspergillus tamarii]
MGCFWVYSRYHSHRRTPWVSLLPLGPTVVFQLVLSYRLSYCTCMPSGSLDGTTEVARRKQLFRMKRWCAVDSGHRLVDKHVSSHM